MHHGKNKIKKILNFPSPINRFYDFTTLPNQIKHRNCYIRIEEDIKMVINYITKALPITYNMICAVTKRDPILQDIMKFLQTGKWLKK